MESLSVTIQMKATEQYFPVVLFTMLYKVVLTFESADGILKCDHLDETSLVKYVHKKIERIRDITFGKPNLFGILEIERVKLSFLSSSALLTL